MPKNTKIPKAFEATKQVTEHLAQVKHSVILMCRFGIT